MKQTKIIAVISVICACVAASSVNAATIPSRNNTDSKRLLALFSSQTAVGRSFEAKLAQDVSVKGHVLLKAGSKVFGKIARLVAIRAKPIRSLWNSRLFR